MPFNTRPLLTLALATSFLAAGASWTTAQGQPANQQGQDGHADTGDHGEGHGEDVFHEAMEQIGGAWRHLRSSAFDDASRQRDLRAAMALQDGLIMAKRGIDSLEMSPRATEKYGEDRAAFEKDVRSQLIKTLSAALDLEKAINDGESGDAKEALDKLNQAQQEGHQMFRPGRDNIGERNGGQGRRPGGQGQEQGQGTGNNQGGM